MKNIILLLSLPFFMFSCTNSADKSKNTNNDESSGYLSFADRDDQYTGGIKMIPIETEVGTFNVWTKTVGNNPSIKVLLLHGGPGFTHEIFECFDGYLPQEGIEYIYYDQLGSYYSDQPDDTLLWTTDRFVDEVEQVRIALGLNKDNFFLYGQSWGALLAMEYALKYQENLKALIISNMMSSIPQYEKYVKEVIAPQLDPEVLAELMEIEENMDFDNPRYMELLMEYYYPEHILRTPANEWPEPVLRTFKHMNPNVYVYMQGFSEFGVTANASLKYWDVSQELHQITVPTLVIGSHYDSMDPEHMRWISEEVADGRFLYCENGSHLSEYDDQKVYFAGLIDFIKEVDNEDRN
jgi:proline iminopeptidase